MAYIVNAEMPKFCNKCPFGFCKFSLPLSDGTHGYTCNLEVHKNGRSKTTVITDYGVDVEKPDWCPLCPVPDKKEKYSLMGDNSAGRVDGWNACIDEILGGAE